MPRCPKYAKYDWFVFWWSWNAKYDIESMWLINLEDYFELSCWPLQVKYNYKCGFEPNCPLDAKYDDASVILNVIYDIESKTNGIVPRWP
jgi:hypothetical protein